MFSDDPVSKHPVRDAVLTAVLIAVGNKVLDFFFEKLKKKKECEECKKRDKKDSAG